MKKAGTQSIKGLSVENLEAAIRRHNRLYFQLHKPEISDYEFDRLVERLKQLKPNSPVLAEIPPESPQEEKEFKKVQHTSEMLSLDKCYSEEDLQDWASKFEGDVIASPKIDGCATELRYDEKGHLFLAATRGNGMIGEEITVNARMISDIPQKITQGPLEIRGEIYMPLSVFKKYEEQFANPRNLTAGAIKQKDPQKTRGFRLSFWAYDVLGLPLKTEAEKFERLRSLGFPVVEMRTVKKEKMSEVYEHFLGKRTHFDFETDGVVFRADLISEQQRLGLTAHHPRYAIAYKFQGDSGETCLVDVEWNVARTSVITPVGIVEPVELSGATVTHVSLHNVGLMKKLGLRKGARVVMMRRGGVIPNLESVVDPGKGSAIIVPKKCPSCGALTEMRDDFLYCTNRDGCRQSKMEELKHFMQVIECDGFGEKLIEKLYDNGFVQDPADFYTLTQENLLELERMGDVLASKLIGNIQAKRRLSLDIFLRALGIRELAKHASKILMREFGTLKNIYKVSEEELSAIHTIGPVIAREVVEGLQRKKPLIEKLLKYVDVGAVPRDRPPEGRHEGLPLQDKKFCFTGSLLTMERPKAQKLVESLGGEAVDSVTQDLDYLVVGDGGGAGAKIEKAKKIQAKGGKLQILTEMEWKKMVGV